MSAEIPETSPAPSTRGGLNHVLQKTLRQRKGNNESSNSIASSDAGRNSLRASIDSAVDRVKARAKGDDEVNEGKGSLTDKLSNRVRKIGRKKKNKRVDEDSLDDIPRGRSVTERDKVGLGTASADDPSKDGDGGLDDDKSGGSSLLTYDSEDESQVELTTPPPLTTRPSHAGYLTLSSPLINIEQQSPSNSVPDNRASVPDVTVNSATDILEAPGRAQTDGTFSGRIRDAISPSRPSTSPDPSSDRETAKAGGGGGLVGLFTSGSSKSGSVASRRASKASENPVTAPLTLEDNTSTSANPPERPRTAKGSTPRIHTVPATPPQSPTPVTTVTPPTPTDPRPSSPNSPSKRSFQASDSGSGGKPSPNPNGTTSSSGNMSSHRRVQSATAVLPRSKLSNATSAPLTPTIEEVRTPGSQGSPSGSGGFFSTVFSAAQNAATTFSNSIGNTGVAPNQSRSKSGIQTGDRDDANKESEGVVTADGRVAGTDSRDKEQKRLAVETLGIGDLSLSHLGISDTSSSSVSPSTADGALEGHDAVKEPSTTVRNDQAAARAEDISAARAVSAAYADKPNEDPSSTPTAEDRGPGGRPRSTHEMSIAGEQTPPNGSVFEGDANIRRSGSVRSRIGARRHRGSSATTGATIGTTLGASNSTLANATNQGITPRLTGFAVASKKRNKDFHNLFKSVPDVDYLIEDYSAALQRDILLAGRLYVSEGHICFSSNILGWVTTLVISFDEVVSMEKKNTAVIFPNAIVINTLHARNVFASLLNRESTYDLLVGIWKISHPNLTSSLNGVRLDEAGGGDKTVKNESESDAGTGDDSETEEAVYDEDLDEDGLGSFTETGDGSIAGSDVGVPAIGAKSASRKPSAIPPSVGAAPGAAQVISEIAAEKVAGAAASPDFPGPATHGPTECGDSATHYDKLLADETIPAPLGKVYSLMFGSASGAFITKFLVDEVKVLELQLDDDKKGLSDDSKTRFYSYIKPLNASIGPKQTKCLTTETLDSLDLEKAVSVTVSTQTPDVPSGNVFLTKTRYCLMWAPGNSTRLLMNCTIEWTGKSWLKGPIEKGASDGQATYAKDILASLRSAVSTKGPRVGPTTGKARGKGRRRKDGTDAAVKPTVGTQENANQARAQQKEDNWGILAPLKGILEPVVDIIKPLVTVNIVLGTVITLLLINWFRRPSSSVESGGIGPYGLGTPQRIAAYEELWRREESYLWDWLEDRIAMDGSAFPTMNGDDDTSTKARSQRNKVLKARGKRPKVGEAEQRMNLREVDEAITVTEERLVSLKALMDRKRNVDGGNGPESTKDTPSDPQFDNVLPPDSHQQNSE